MSNQNDARKPNFALNGLPVDDHGNSLVPVAPALRVRGPRVLAHRTRLITSVVVGRFLDVAFPVAFTVGAVSSALVFFAWTYAPYALANETSIKVVQAKCSRMTAATLNLAKKAGKFTPNSVISDIPALLVQEELDLAAMRASYGFDCRTVDRVSELTTVIDHGVSEDSLKRAAGKFEEVQDAIKESAARFSRLDPSSHRQPGHLLNLVETGVTPIEDVVASCDAGAREEGEPSCGLVIRYDEIVTLSERTAS